MNKVIIMVKKNITLTFVTTYSDFPTGVADFELISCIDVDTAPLSTEKQLCNELFESDLRSTQKVLCVERHQRTKVGYLSVDTKACQWGRDRENATSCGDCPFGVKLFEYGLKNDTGSTLKKLKHIQNETNKIFQ